MQGFPTHEAFETLKNNLKQRFSQPEKSGGPTPVATEALVTYIYKILDRQISKAAGLLSYNALLLGSISLITQGGAKVRLPANLGRIAALVSAGLLLLIMYVHWGEAGEFTDAERDFQSVSNTVRERTWLISGAVIISGIATVCALLALIPSKWLLEL